MLLAAESDPKRGPPERDRDEEKKAEEPPAHGPIVTLSSRAMKLVASRLSRSFGPRRIFGPLSFEVQPGHVLGVAGANGSGKTTLLKTLCGLLRPTTGTVHLEGSARLTPREAPLLIGWVAPDLNLYAELTPAENLSFFARVAGRPAALPWIEERIRGVGLDPTRLRGATTRSLSTGMRQRLKLAFATLADPPVLLLDEPSSNLDEPGRAIVMKVVAEQRQRGLAVIASNDPRDLALADETIAVVSEALARTAA